MARYGIWALFGPQGSIFQHLEIRRPGGASGKLFGVISPTKDRVLFPSPLFGLCGAIQKVLDASLLKNPRSQYPNNYVVGPDSQTRFFPVG